MSNVLVPCPACARHVRGVETACPFCAAILPAGLAATAVPNTTQRLGRAALFVFSTTLALTGCKKPGEPATMTPGGGAPSATAPGVHGGPDPETDPGGREIYGAPPPPMHMSLYGGAAPPLAAPHDAGPGVMGNAYGSPPPR